VKLQPELLILLPFLADNSSSASGVTKLDCTCFTNLEAGGTLYALGGVIVGDEDPVASPFPEIHHADDQAAATECTLLGVHRDEVTSARYSGHELLVVNLHFCHLPL